MRMSRRRLLPAIIISAGLVMCGFAHGEAPTVLHHNLSVALHPPSQTLEATDALTVKPGGGSSFVFALNPEARISEVKAGGQALPFTFERGELRVSPPSSPQGGSTGGMGGEGNGTGNLIEVEVSYALTLRDSPPADTTGSDDPSFGVFGSISPAGVFISGATRWYPELPGSRPTFAATIRAPAGMTAVTSGMKRDIRTEAGYTISSWETDYPIPDISISAGSYHVGETRINGIPIYTFLSIENASLSDDYLSASAHYIELYGNLFGYYPFEKFAVVENFLPTGYGFPSYTLIGGTVLRLPFILATSLGHEIAHSWWGNCVWVDYSRGNWSEGLTTYVSDYLYKEMSSPAAAREYRLQILRDYASLVPPEKDIALEDFIGRVSPATRAVGYGKGAMVFHMARRLVGNDIFWSGLRQVYSDKRFQKASWDDFSSAFSRPQGSAGKETGPFFRQWIDRPGAPVLSLESIRTVFGGSGRGGSGHDGSGRDGSRRSGAGWKVTGEIVQEAPFYSLDVPLRLEVDGDGAPVETIVSISGGREKFSIHSDKPPVRLIADPDVDVFRRLHASEIPPTVNELRGTASESLVVVRTESLPDDVAAASEVFLRALGLRDAPRYAEADLPADGMKGRNVLFLGAPRNVPRFLDLPSGFSVAPDGFTIDGEAYADPGDALFIVRRPPGSDSSGIVAVFLPLSADAASTAAVKIPHYGKYGFLAFQSGVNRAKGVWPITKSPLIHDFPRKETSS